MQKGTCKCFDPKKCYGFLVPETGGSDVFVHISDLANGVKTLESNQSVMFELETGKNGRPRAVDVRAG